jgi:hypothetical protein
VYSLPRIRTTTAYTKQTKGIGRRAREREKKKRENERAH